jgi:hypothetical protein
MKSFLTGLLLLLASLVLQFWAASFGYSFDLAFAVLIACAFVLDWAELLPLTALTVLVLNWQPAVSPAILAYAFFPVAVRGLRQFLQWQSWVGVLVAAALGAGLVALAAGLNFGVIGWSVILLDATAMASFGLFVFWMLAV